MGKLANRIENLSAIKQKMALADKSTDIKQDDLDSLLDNRFNAVSDRLNGALDRLMAESDKQQDKTLTKAPHSNDQITVTCGIFERGRTRFFPFDFPFAFPLSLAAVEIVFSSRENGTIRTWGALSVPRTCCTSLVRVRTKASRARIFATSPATWSSSA